jgi:hypothetical protein
VLLPFVPAGARADSATIDLGALHADDAVFWDDGYVASDPLYGVPAAPSPNGVDRCLVQSVCFRFSLDVLDQAEALRVGFDTPMRDDNFEIIVTDPNGVATRATNPNSYSVELLFAHPATGRWSIRIAPYSAEQAPFRVRAKLESVHYRPTPDANGYLLPNLQVTRMWEFGFIAPANPLNGLFPPDDTNPPLDIAGVRPVSCAADETVDDGSNRCLRYSFGLANVGDGVFDVRWMGGDRLSDHDMVQCLQRGDGTTEAHPAGTGSWHWTHGHWHYLDIIRIELDRVAAPGLLEPVGDGKKLGYSPADQGMPQWDRFVQAPAGTSGSAGNCRAGADNRLGMSAGWGDTYRYQRPGNYANFADAGDGEFVVRTIADPLDHVREADETDNVSYAHIRVAGVDVQLLEFGRGASPWDPNKVVIPDWWTA